MKAHIRIFTCREFPVDGHEIALLAPLWVAQMFCGRAFGDHEAPVKDTLQAPETHRTTTRAPFTTRARPTDGREIGLLDIPLGSSNVLLANMWRGFLAFWGS